MPILLTCPPSLNPGDEPSFISPGLHFAKIKERAASEQLPSPATSSQLKEKEMSKQNVEDLLIAGGDDPEIRAKYDSFKTKEEFIAKATEEGYEFTIEQLDEVLRESGDSFESYGNPPKRSIWWH